MTRFHPPELLDANPGVTGFRHYFLFLAGIAMLGILVVLALLALRARGNLWPDAERNTGMK